MKTINFTRVPTREVSRYIRFAIKYVGATDLVKAVVLLPDLDVHGTISLDPKDGKYVLLVCVSASTKYPYHYQYPGLKKAPNYTVGDVAEHIVSTVAHEAFHTLQEFNDIDTNEVHAEIVSKRAIEAWRQKQSSRHGRRD